MTKPIPNKNNIGLWNKLVDEVFNHKKSRFSLFVYEMIKRRVLGIGNMEYRANATSDKIYGVKNIE